jgi:Uma2 family endonuclease
VTTREYLNTDETNRKRELRFGRLREPPAPFFSHQQLVLRVARLLSSHVEPRNLGAVAIAPIDVILDADKHLVVQPDVVFVARERQAIVQNQIWGAPDLVVEVLSIGTETRDRGEKLAWYQHYGVRECWLVDVREEAVTVIDLTSAASPRQVARGVDTIRSSVLPALETSAFGVFA